MSPNNPFDVSTIPATDSSPEEKLYQGHNGIVGEVEIKGENNSSSDQINKRGSNNKDKNNNIGSIN
jgi:hypothetical protein